MRSLGIAIFVSSILVATAPAAAWTASGDKYYPVAGTYDALAEQLDAMSVRYEEEGRHIFLYRLSGFMRDIGMMRAGAESFDTLSCTGQASGSLEPAYFAMASMALKLVDEAKVTLAAISIEELRPMPDERADVLRTLRDTEKALVEVHNYFDFLGSLNSVYR